MAKMWPERLPRSVRNNPLRSAECRIYDRLNKCLGDDWVVFYSRPWLGLSSAGEEIDGEADFVVAHPDWGYLTIEVKGGAIVYDPAADKWTSKDRHGIVFDIKNPVHQARSAKYNILEQLKGSRYWTPQWVRARHGIVFPDTRMRDVSLGLDKPRAIFADKDESDHDIGAWVKTRLKSPESDDRPAVRPFSVAGVKVLERLLAAPFHLRVPLGHYLDDDDKDIEVLTERQYQLLAAIKLIPRAAIRGAAGTGKTVLAVEAAKRASEEGHRVLLTCYNVALASVLKARIGGEIDVMSFHSLCGTLAAKAGLSTQRTTSEAEFYENTLPTLLADAADLLPSHRYDTIVVDEGQDFRSHWWPALDSLLAPGGRLLIFHDANQKFYANQASLPADTSAVPITLNQNLRNTQRIHEVVMRHYQGEPVIASDVPGQMPEVHVAASSSAIADQCGRVVSRLVDTERVSPDDIVILVAEDAERMRLCGDGSLGPYPTKRCDEQRDGAITVDTVRRFKGLEGRAVVLIASPKLVADPAAAYVSTSRARTHLIAIGDDAALTALGIVKR